VKIVPIAGAFAEWRKAHEQTLAQQDSPSKKRVRTQYRQLPNLSPQGLRFGKGGGPLGLETGGLRFGKPLRF
jgi:hypothetical protein